LFIREVWLDLTEQVEFFSVTTTLKQAASKINGLDKPIKSWISLEKAHL